MRTGRRWFSSHRMSASGWWWWWCPSTVRFGGRCMAFSNTSQPLCTDRHTFDWKQYLPATGCQHGGSLYSEVRGGDLFMVSSSTSWVMVTWDTPSLVIQTDRHQTSLVGCKNTWHDVHATVNSQNVQLSIKLADPEEGIHFFSISCSFQETMAKNDRLAHPPPPNLMLAPSVGRKSWIRHCSDSSFVVTFQGKNNVS